MDSKIDFLIFDLYHLLIHVNISTPLSYRVQLFDSRVVLASAFSCVFSISKTCLFLPQTSSIALANIVLNKLFPSPRRVILWEQAISFRDEIGTVWKTSRWSATRVAFLINRYFAIFGMFLYMVNSCRPHFRMLFLPARRSWRFTLSTKFTGLGLRSLFKRSLYKGTLDTIRHQFDISTCWGLYPWRSGVCCVGEEHSHSCWTLCTDEHVSDDTDEKEGSSSLLLKGFTANSERWEPNCGRCMPIMRWSCHKVRMDAYQCQVCTHG